MGASARRRMTGRMVTGSESGPVWRDDARALQMYRARVQARILSAGTDGRLDPAEFAARSQAAEEVTTLRDLARIIADIPGPGQAAVAGHHRGIRRVILGVLGLAGYWPFRALAARVLAAAVLGEVVIDLRRTAVTSFETEITVVALAGEVRLVVPAGYRVESGPAVTVLGRTASTTPPDRGDALTPVIRLRSLAVLGNVLTSQVPAAA